MSRVFVALVALLPPGHSATSSALAAAPTTAPASQSEWQEGDTKPGPIPADHARRLAHGLELFKARVSGLLKTHCLKCHGGKKTEGDFDLSSREAMLRGGATGPAVVPFDSRLSLLYKLVSHADEPGMPYETDKLPEKAIAQVRDWIDSGAPYEQPLVSRPSAPKGRSIVTDEDRKFWSFLPLGKIEPPPVADKSWCRSPMDHFILARLEDKHIAPSPAVDRRKLIRRATFDLIGLPPTPEEIETFVNNTSPDAYEKLVDRLLASPHYGERWARHWLDLARFAESHGYEDDHDRPTAYHYRDFVIRALNEDMPYDRFVALQIAGDELEPYNPQALMATGFLAAGTHATVITANQVEKERYDELDDMTATIGSSMLGLTIGCARCHDHKFDPIPQTDYYRLLSTFTTTVRSDLEIDLHPEQYREAKKRFDVELAPLADSLAQFEKDQLPLRLKNWLDARSEPTDARLLVLATDAVTSAVTVATARRPFALPLVATASYLVTPANGRTTALQAWFASTDADWRKLNATVAESLQRAPRPHLIKALVCTEGVPAIRFNTQGPDFLETTHILKRGDPNQKLEIASQSFLHVLMTGPENELRWQTRPPTGSRTSYRRRSLTNWITDVNNGAGRLLARVIVNRVWQHHVGRGIVATPSDFGAQGERPTHPELLDWLAVELIREGWRLKPLHRLIMTSAVYKQGNSSDAALLAVDPDNKLFGRRGQQRLEAEAIRDSMLAVSGLLDPKMFGPGTLDQSMRRRSIYFTVKRSQLVPLMMLFDAPDSLQGLGSRGTTTVAPQALAMMNDPQVQQSARALARRLLDKAGSKSLPTVDEVDVIGGAYELALGRRPSTDEIADARNFVKCQRESYAAARRLATKNSSKETPPVATGPSAADQHAVAEAVESEASDKENIAAEMALADFCQALFCLTEFMYTE